MNKRGNHWIMSAAISAMSLAAMSTAAEAQQAQQAQITIEAQDLGGALRELARATGSQILFRPELVRDKRAPAISGALTVQEAMGRLLQGSDLVFTQTDKTTFTIVPTSSPGPSPIQFDEAPGPATDAEPTDMIVVLGVRASLATAVRLKRNSDAVTDSIVADDIAKFPAENLAEAIQRIPGVAIARDQGEGTTASLRGLPPSLVLVQVNGQTAVTGKTGREFSFDVFSADLFSKVEVVKSSSADRDEGGVAGTINLSTPNPLDLADGTVRANISGSYVELADKYDARGSALFSRKFADDRLGVVLGLTYSDRSLRQDNSSGNGWDPLTLDLNGDGTAEFTNTYVPRTLRTQLFLEDRSRIGAAAKIQFLPTDNSELTFDAAYTNFEVDRYRTNHSFAFSTGTPSAILKVDGDTAVAGTIRNTRVRTTIRTETEMNEILMLGLKGHIDLDDWMISGALSHGFAQTRLPDGAVVRYEARANVTYDVSADPRFPEITGAPDPITGAGMKINQLAFDSFENKDTETAAQGDVERRFDGWWLSRISAGLKLRERNKERGATDDTIAIAGGRPLTDIILPFPVSDFFDGQGGQNFRRAHAIPDINEVRARYYPASVPFTPDPLDTFEVKEKSYAGYVRGDLDFDIGGMNILGDVGVRVVTTEQTSSGFVVDGSGVISPIEAKRDYTDTLPSANLRMNITDDLLLRVGAASVMTRPAMNDISPRREIFPGQLRVEEGNVNLDPFRANQIDISLEYYPGNEALLSAALFYKDIKSFTATRETLEPFRSETYLFSRIVNGDGGEVSGLELTYQQPFVFLPAPFDGLGAAFTYTYADSLTSFPSAISTQELPLEGLSKNSYNATLYYEKDRLGLRASYNFRDGYVLTALGAGGSPVLVDDYGQLDLSGSFQIVDRVAVRFEVLNARDERTYSYSGRSNRITNYDRAGPKYFLGLSASF